MVGLVGLVTLVAFEAIAVATAMPVVARELGGVRSYGLAFSLFLTMQLLGTVVAGGWADARGPRGPVLAGLALFTGGLVVCGAAQSFPELLVGRLVSGAGGGLLVVAMYVIVGRAYAEDVRPSVFGRISAAWVLPSVAGPPIAGWLADDVSWRLVFLAIAPLGLLTVVALLPRLSRRQPGAARPAPIAGARQRALRGLGLAVGATLLQWGGQEVERNAAWAVPALVAGAALLAGCLPALLPPGTLRLARGLPAVIAVRGMFTGAFFAAEAFVPLMLVQERGLAPPLAGLALTGAALGWVTGAWLQGRPKAARHRVRLPSVGAALIAVAIGLLPLAVLDAVTPAIVFPLWVLAGLGMGLAASTTGVLVLERSPEGEQGRDSAALQVADALGVVLGIGAAGAAFAAVHDPGGSDAGVFTAIWLCFAVLAAAAAVAGRRVRSA